MHREVKPLTISNALNVLLNKYLQMARTKNLEETFECSVLGTPVSASVTIFQNCGARMELTFLKTPYTFDNVLKV